MIVHCDGLNSSALSASLRIEKYTLEGMVDRDSIDMNKEISDGGAAMERASPSPTPQTQMTLLPEAFEPSDDDVLVGRGKTCFNHVGNQRFRVKVTDYLEEYARAKTKADKSVILTKVVSEVRKKSPLGGFVKKDNKTNRWFEVGDFLAREKTSQCFRDALHDQYRSSTKSKKKRRQAEQAKASAKLKNIARSQVSISSRMQELSAEVGRGGPEDQINDMFNRTNMEILKTLNQLSDQRKIGDPSQFRQSGMDAFGSSSGQPFPLAPTYPRILYPSQQHEFASYRQQQEPSFYRTGGDPNVLFSSQEASFYGQQQTPAEHAAFNSMQNMPQSSYQSSSIRDNPFMFRAQQELAAQRPVHQTLPPPAFDPVYQGGSQPIVPGLASRYATQPNVPIPQTNAPQSYRMEMIASSSGHDTNPFEPFPLVDDARDDRKRPAAVRDDLCQSPSHPEL